MPSKGIKLPNAMILISKIKTSEALTNLRFELEVRFVRRKNLTSSSNLRFVSVARPPKEKSLI